MRARFYSFLPLWLFLLIIPSVLFLFAYGLPMTHDGATHLLRIGRLDEHLRNGYIFPRWIPDLILGHGYPVLNYYAAGTYYLVESFHLLGMNLYYAFIAAQFLLIYLAAVGIYLFAADLFGRDGRVAALVTTAAYIYTPYLLTNVYVRGAIAELGAQMLLPWILWSFRRIWLHPTPQRYVPIAIFALGALAWTHTISLLIVPPLLIAYLLVLFTLSAQPWSSFRWSAVAILGAIGITCFYWLPVLVERHDISDVGFAISRTLMLPISFIDWHNFLDMGWRYTFPEDPPFRFGLIQVIGVLVGVLFLWRKPREYWFWLGVLLFCLFMMTDVTKPLWLNNDILPIIQFPWRLLAVVGVPAAILFGLPLKTLSSLRVQVAAAALLIPLLIWAHFPHLPWAYILTPESNFTMALNAYFETDRTYVVSSGEMTTTVQEFRPKWAGPTLTLDPETVTDAPVTLTAANGTDGISTINLLAADPFHLRFQAKSAVAFPLRLATYYFPGWVAHIEEPRPSELRADEVRADELRADQADKLEPYPSTNLGLLTIDVPAGNHIVTVAWEGTPIAAVAGMVSQITLLLIALWQLFPRLLAKRQGRVRTGNAQGTDGQATEQKSMLGFNAERWWGVVPLLFLGIGLVATYRQLPVPPVMSETTIDVAGLQLLGYHEPTLRSDDILVQLYWLTTQTSPPPITLALQLRAADQTVVAETVSAPFYDAYTTEQWANHMLVDDAYLLPLPQVVEPGRYTVALIPLDPITGDRGDELVAGTVDLPKGRGLVPPEQVVDFRYRNAISLIGYTQRVVERLPWRTASLAKRPEIPVVESGRTVRYILYWQTAAETNEPYVSFMHMTDHFGQPIAQSDHLPGPLFVPPALWTTYNQYRDQFLLEIPKTTSSGLYWPNVGMYNWKEQRRIGVQAADSTEEQDHAKLPPIKVLNRSIRAQGTAVNVQFGTTAQLTHVAVTGGVYAAEQDKITAQPGDTLTLTNYYQVEEASDQELRRFVQIRNGDQQMLVQFDSEPQNGVNPTWAWVPGETVADPVSVTIPPDADAGTYTIYLGFYHPAADFERLPVFDEQGTALANREYPLFTLTVTPVSHS
ncbi:MAG TPA: 6-pyruvoyl-tetrahydropterin synthase-related protein [Caldilineaceae bacterium]|nr:6-pyruvoyl-tetrahydropterin synthase-related protein [Caldilineaceae bacterium]